MFEHTMSYPSMILFIRNTYFSWYFDIWKQEMWLWGERRRSRERENPMWQPNQVENVFWNPCLCVWCEMSFEFCVLKNSIMWHCVGFVIRSFYFLHFFGIINWRGLRIEGKCSGKAGIWKIWKFSGFKLDLDLVPKFRCSLKMSTSIFGHCLSKKLQNIKLIYKFIANIFSSQFMNNPHLNKLCL